MQFPFRPDSVSCGKIGLAFPQPPSIPMSQENLILLLFGGAALGTGGLVWRFFRRRPGSAPPALTWRRWVAGNVRIVLFLLALFLVGGEVYYRFFHDSSDAYMLSKVSRRWLHRHYQINRSEVRDSVEYAWGIQPGRRRITFIGDSFTVGHGVPDVEDRFANRIRRQRPDWEIHVLAQNGWETGDELDLLETQLRPQYEFDQVVLVYVLNDLSDLATEYWIRAMQRVTRRWPLPPFLRESYFLNTWYYRLRIILDPDLADYFHFTRDWYRGPMWNVQEARLRRLHAAVSRRGGRLLVVTFPFLQSPAGQYPFLDVHAQLAGLWKSLDVPHLDLAPVLLPRGPRRLAVNRFDAHPNEQAHALAAAAIEEFIQIHLADQPVPATGADR